MIRNSLKFIFCQLIYRLIVAVLAEQENISKDVNLDLQITKTAKSSAVKSTVFLLRCSAVKVLRFF